jgi:xanthine dehydrogenase accessory factor
MSSLCQAVLECFQTNARLVLATMMDQSGSAPRAAGARMLVRPDGSLWGTVGGGRYEAEAIGLAMSLLRRQDAEADPLRFRRGAVAEYTLAGVTDMDMICGGKLSLLLEVLPRREAVRAMFEAGRAAEVAGRPFVFLSRFFREADRPGEALAPAPQGPGLPLQAGKAVPVRVERLLYLPESKTLLPTGSEVPAPILAQADALQGVIPSHCREGEAEYLLEGFPRPFRIIIFGGGHVSLELAKLAQGIDFPVTVLDDRPEFADAARFPGARVMVPPTLGEGDCADALESLGVGPRDGIVIVTRGHSHDRDALAAALRGKAGYIGMIGSRTKRLAVYAALEKSGVSRERLAGVHSPIGLAIGAETPAEIAVSIAAELILWRKTMREGEVGAHS